MGFTAGIALGQGGDSGDNVYGGRVAGGAGLEEHSMVAEGEFQRALQRGFAWSWAGREAGSDGESALGGVDVPPTPVPPQGRTQVAAAGESVHETVDGLGGNVRVNGATMAGVAVDAPVVSYTALGNIVAAYPWPINRAFAVVDCESRWDPNAVSWNGSSYGLFQIWQGHFWRWPNAWSEWGNPEVNTRWAWELWQEQGWGIWSCS